ncbi:unnamed protein product [Amoebophrya sp. A25]|nr:unnamed protein product [Amoebophrya sp. A25]|eukprot:GSA25T00016973001.1
MIAKLVRGQSSRENDGGASSTSTSKEVGSAGGASSHTQPEDNRTIPCVRSRFDSSVLRFRDWVFPKWALCPTLIGTTAVPSPLASSFFRNYIMNSPATVQKTSVIHRRKVSKEQVSPRKHCVNYGSSVDVQGSVMNAELRALSNSLENQGYDGAAMNLWTRLAEFGPEILWTLWHLAIAGDPLVIYGDSTVVDDAVFACLQLIRPLDYCGDFRPHFTVYDPDFRDDRPMTRSSSAVSRTSSARSDTAGDAGRRVSSGSAVGAVFSGNTASTSTGTSPSSSSTSKEKPLVVGCANPAVFMDLTRAIKSSTGANAAVSPADPATSKAKKVSSLLLGGGGSSSGFGRSFSQQNLPSVSQLPTISGSSTSTRRSDDSHSGRIGPGEAQLADTPQRREG